MHILLEVMIHLFLVFYFSTHRPQLAYSCERSICLLFAFSALGPYFVVGHDSSITRGLVIYKIVTRAEAWRSVNGTLVSVVAVMKLSGLMYSNVKAVALAHNQVN